MTDPLSINVPLAGVSTEIPLLPEGDYTMQIVESAPVINKKQTGYNWNLKLATTEPTTAVDGHTPINPNFPIFVNNIALQPAEDSTDKEAFRRGIASVIDAVLGTNENDRPAFDRALWESVVGKTVRVRLSIEEYMGKKSNKVRSWLKPTA